MGLMEVKKVTRGQEPDDSFLPCQGIINEILERGDNFVIKLNVYRRGGKIEEFEVPKIILTYYPCKIGDMVIISSSVCAEHLPAIAVLS